VEQCITFSVSRSLPVLETCPNHVSQKPKTSVNDWCTCGLHHWADEVCKAIAIIYRCIHTYIHTGVLRLSITAAASVTAAAQWRNYTGS